MEWLERALCKGKDTSPWFPPIEVKTLESDPCEGCPVRAECLEYAKSKKGTYGVWGGVLLHDSKPA
jgi:WhiB family redox-sensing transcriptional regulator